MSRNNRPYPATRAGALRIRLSEWTALRRNDAQILRDAAGALAGAVGKPRRDSGSTTGHGGGRSARFLGIGALLPVPGSPKPVGQDPAHRYISNDESRVTGQQPTQRISDISNANLKQWAKDVMKKDNDEVLAGKFAFTARSSCKPAGVPGFDVLLGGALFILQSPVEVTMIFSGNVEARHIRLNSSHSANPKPSWYGESVGHYEGDTLVVDTIGLNDKTFLDNYRTPHTDKLHVTERWRMIEDGKKLEILMTIDDPDTFYQPWQALRQYDRVRRTLSEDICSENNINPFGIDYGMPVAEKPDF
jgi:hypothetical protein